MQPTKEQISAVMKMLSDKATQSMTAEQRKARAKKAAQTRWAKTKEV